MNAFISQEEYNELKIDYDKLLCIPINVYLTFISVLFEIIKDK